MNQPAVLQLREVRRPLVRLGDVLEVLRTEGPLTFARHVIQKYGNALFAHLHFFEFPLAEAMSSASSQTLPDGVSLRACRGEDDLAWLVRVFAQAGWAPAIIKQRMRRGDAAIVATAGAELVGYSWATFKERWLSEIRATIVPRADEIVEYDTRIMPRWRGNGLQSSLYLGLLPYLSRFGHRRTLTGVSAFNTASLRCQKRLGKREVADIISQPVLRILRLQNRSATDGIIVERRLPS